MNNNFEFIEFVAFIGFKSLTGEDVIQELCIQNIAADEGEVGILFCLGDVTLFAHWVIEIIEVIKTKHVAALFQEPITKMGADKSCSTGDQNSRELGVNSHESGDSDE